IDAATSDQCARRQNAAGIDAVSGRDRFSLPKTCSIGWSGEYLRPAGWTRVSIWGSSDTGAPLIKTKAEIPVMALLFGGAPRMRATIWAAVLTCVLAASAYSQQGAPSAVPVGIVIAERKPISKTLDFVGRVEAINRVEIRARVKGYLEAVLFKEGDLVNEGAALYRIEKDLFKAAVEQAQGELQSSKAQHDLAVKNRHRQEELYAKNVSAGMALDEAVGKEGEAKGAVLTNEANLATAQINLGYTEIVSPITGKVGRTALTKGNV